MDVEHIILGRPWLYIRDVTIYGRPNSYSFVYEGKKIKLAPLRPWPTPETKQTDASNNKKVLMLINPELIDKEIAGGPWLMPLLLEKLVMILGADSSYSSPCIKRIC